MRAGPLGRTRLPEMPVASRNPREVRKHLKEVGVTKLTLQRYTKAVNSFVAWRHFNNIPVARGAQALDNQVGEYFNFLYQSYRPLHHAGDCLSGLKRLYPFTRRLLDTAGLYYKNWVRVTKRRKALPLSSKLVRGMAAVAVGQGNLGFALSLLIAFLGLLRTGEVLAL